MLSGVAMFAISLLSDAKVDVTTLVARIAQSGRDGLLFAGLVLADGVQVESVYAEQIIQQLIIWIQNLSGIELIMADVLLDILTRLRHHSTASKAILTLSKEKNLSITIRLRALKAIEKLGAEKDTIATLLVLLEDRGPIRRNAESILQNIASKRDVTSTLLDLSRDTEIGQELRILAAKQLEKLGDPKQAVQAWLTLACDVRTDVETCKVATKRMVKLGYIDQAAQVCIAMAQNENVNVIERWGFVMELINLGHSEYAMQAFSNLMRDRRIDATMRIFIANLLGELGFAKECSDALVSIACEEPIHVSARIEAADKLASLGLRDKASKLLVSLIHDERLNPPTQLTVINKLKDLNLIGSNERAIVARKLRAIVKEKSADSMTRWLAARVLAQLGRIEEAGEALFALAYDDLTSSLSFFRIYIVEDLITCIPHFLKRV